MTPMFAQIQAESAILMSWLKPIIFTVTLLGWAWVVSHLDKDAEYYYLKRHLLNLGLMGFGVVAFGMMLLLPIFLLGWLLGLLLIVASFVGYAFYRNSQVPEDAQWTLSLESFTKRIDKRQQEQAKRRAIMALLDKSGDRVEVPVGDNPFAAAHVFLEDLFEYALQRGSDHVEVAVQSEKAAAFVWIDGVRYQREAPEPQVGLQLVDYVKTAAGLDVEDRRKRQFGHLGLDAGELGHNRKLEVDTAGSTRGVMISMRIDPARRVEVPFTQLGMLDQQQEKLEAAITDKGKVIIVASPANHGGTTTLHSLIAKHDPYTSNIVTLQREIPFELEGVSHTLVPDTMTGDEINEKLGAILRGDPSVMVMPDIVEPRNAKLLAQAAEDMRVYTKMNANDTFAALQGWIKEVGDQKLAAETLGAIVSQRLVRRLCTTCRVAYKPDAAALKKLNLPVERVNNFYNPSGQVVVKEKPQECPDCRGLAYRGRIGVFEVMTLDEEARGYIAAGDLNRLRAHLRKQRMLWLQEAALARVVEGVTSIKEVTRVLSGGKRAASNGGNAKAKPSQPAQG